MNEMQNIYGKQARRRRSSALPAAALLLVLLSACVADDLVDAWTAQSRVNAAYFAKLQQCAQTEPFFLLFVPFDVKEADVRACEAETLASGCPLTRLPASCALLMFKREKPVRPELRSPGT